MNSLFGVISVLWYKWVNIKQIKFCTGPLDVFLTDSYYLKCIKHQSTCHQLCIVKKRLEWSSSICLLESLLWRLKQAQIIRYSLLVHGLVCMQSNMFSSCHRHLCIRLHSFKWCFEEFSEVWREIQMKTAACYGECLLLWSGVLNNPFKVLFIVRFITCSSEWTRVPGLFV